MAERRMFAKTIIDSDAFLDMPLSAQALYFHLSMRADDEGFINNPKKIQRMIGASDDDMRILLAKNFILEFESGVIVIKHWKIHNYIRGDRLNQTAYQDERALLTVKENGAYTLNDDLKEIECLDATDMRKLAYKESTLPYSFTYKIKRAFEGKPCPVCGRAMNSAYKTTMPTVQHNIPISKGGKHEIENISIICESCNTSIRDKETDSLNTVEVMEMWDKIIEAEKNNIKWFWDVSALDRQMTDKCQADVSIGKDSIGNNKGGRFTPPSVDEVKNYCLERKNGIDPQAFVDFYSSKGWMIGSNKMKDWKACVRTWEKRRGKTKPSNQHFTNENTYDFEDLERRLLGD